MQEHDERPVCPVCGRQAWSAGGPCMNVFCPRYDPAWLPEPEVEPEL